MNPNIKNRTTNNKMKVPKQSLFFRPPGYVNKHINTFENSKTWHETEIEREIGIAKEKGTISGQIPAIASQNNKEKSPTDFIFFEYWKLESNFFLRMNFYGLFGNFNDFMMWFYRTNLHYFYSYSIF